MPLSPLPPSTSFYRPSVLTAAVALACGVILAVITVFAVNWALHPLPDTSAHTTVIHTDPASLLLPTAHPTTIPAPHSIDEWLSQVAGAPVK